MVLVLLLTPAFASAQEPKAMVPPTVNEVPAVKPPVAPLIPDTTKSGDEAKEITGPGPVTRQTDRVPAPRPESPPAAVRADDVVRPRGACPDPATVYLSARLVGRTDPSRGVGIIEIVGRVRNVGRGAYVSEPRQQSVELIEEQVGTPPRTVTEQTFTNLAPNETRTVVHRRSWDTSTEFQPRYRLRIVYEPDIRTDANPRNDDCGLANNEATLEPDRINALFP